MRQVPRRHWCWFNMFLQRRNTMCNTYLLSLCYKVRYFGRSCINMVNTFLRIHRHIRPATGNEYVLFFLCGHQLEVLWDWYMLLVPCHSSAFSWWHKIIVYVLHCADCGNLLKPTHYRLWLLAETREINCCHNVSFPLCNGLLAVANLFNVKCDISPLYSTIVLSSILDWYYFAFAKFNR